MGLLFKCLVHIYVYCFQIEVGMTFTKDTTLQVRNPVNLEQAASYSQMSMFFKTKLTDGFLAYVGPDRYQAQQDVRFFCLPLTLCAPFIDLHFKVFCIFLQFTNFSVTQSKIS